MHDTIPKREVRKLLGLVGYCRIWVESYTHAVKFLYEKLIEEEPMIWTKQDDKRLSELKSKLASAPALSLPSLNKPFDLHVSVESGIAHGVLTQEWGAVRKLLAFLSKLLDPVTRGWPTYIQAVAATSALAEESNKLTFGGRLRVHASHDVRSVLS